MPGKKEKLWLKMVKPWGEFKGKGEIVPFDKSKGLRRIADGTAVKATRAEIRQALPAAAKPPARQPKVETATASPPDETADSTPQTGAGAGKETADSTPETNADPADSKADPAAKGKDAARKAGK